MNRGTSFHDPDSYRIEMAARLFSLNVDHLMQLAIDGTIGLFIHGGGRDFLEVKCIPGQAEGEGTFRSEGEVSSHCRMYVDRVDLSAMQARGWTVLKSALVSCDDSSRWFVPTRGQGGIQVSTSDLWVFAKDLPRSDAQYMQPDGETRDARRIRRLDIWINRFGGSVHKVRDQWKAKADAGVWTEFLQSLAGEKGSNAKTVRKDLQEAAEAKSNASKLPQARN